MSWNGDPLHYAGLQQAALQQNSLNAFNTGISGLFAQGQGFQGQNFGTDAYGYPVTAYGNITSFFNNSPTPQEPELTGTKHVVVCNGSSVECDSLKEAQAKAEELAASTQRNAYVLKPISVTKPKRETVTEPIE